METEFQNETFDEAFTYRDITVQIWNDDYGQQKFLRFLNDPLFGTQDIGLGSYNFNYKEDIMYLIDKKLDTIYVFEDPCFGCTLEWFFNGYGNRDIRLTCRSRAIKLFLVEDPSKIDVTSLISDSKEYLNTYLKHHKKTGTYIDDVIKADN